MLPLVKDTRQTLPKTLTTNAIEALKRSAGAAHAAMRQETIQLGHQLGQAERHLNDLFSRQTMIGVTLTRGFPPPYTWSVELACKGM
jgi:hypothetical protein